MRSRASGAVCHHLAFLKLTGTSCDRDFHQASRLLSTDSAPASSSSRIRSLRSRPTSSWPVSVRDGRAGGTLLRHHRTAAASGGRLSDAQPLVCPQAACVGSPESWRAFSSAPSAPSHPRPRASSSVPSDSLTSLDIRFRGGSSQPAVPSSAGRGRSSPCGSSWAQRRQGSTRERASTSRRGSQARFTIHSSRRPSARNFWVIPRHRSFCMHHHRRAGRRTLAEAPDRLRDGGGSPRPPTNAGSDFGEAYAVLVLGASCSGIIGARIRFALLTGDRQAQEPTCTPPSPHARASFTAARACVACRRAACDNAAGHGWVHGCPRVAVALHRRRRAALFLAGRCLTTCGFKET